MSWKPACTALVLFVVIASHVDVAMSSGDGQTGKATNQNEFDNNNPLKKVIEQVENNPDVVKEERTYVFGKNGKVIHNYVEDHREIHKDGTEQMVQAYQDRQNVLENAKNSGEGVSNLDPHSEQEENYQKLREELKKQTNGAFYDPEVEAAGNENTTTSSNKQSRTKRIMEKSDWRRWPKAIVPYKVAEDNLAMTVDYQRSMALFEHYTCLRFVPWNETINEQLGLGHPGHLKFIKSGGCWSYQGNIRWSNGQSISCCKGYTCVHEIGHALGVGHEHQSPQRDGWIRVNEDNIMSSGRGSYNRAGDNSYMYFQGYDLSSIMHYSTWGFSSGGPTMSFLFPELFLDDNDFYMFYEISKTHKCHEKEECEGFDIKCENDGYQTVVNGKCACRCPTGLDPQTGCTTNIRVPDGLKMPTGQYALPKPKTGCPDSSFQDGQLTHYGEGGNYKSDPFSLMGEFKGSKGEHHFCTRTIDDGPVGSDEDEIFGEKSDWPYGMYCILKKGGECPARFFPGFIQYDDIDQEGSQSGELPDGVYGNNTRMESCCQYSGFHKDPILLPVDKPFTLFAFGSKCQEVLGMASRMEKYVFDSTDEGYSKVDTGIKHHLNKDRDILAVYYCHYRPVDLDCGGVIQIDASNPEIEIVSNSSGRPDMECTWLVKGPHENGTLVLDFEEFDVRADDKDKCVDSVEVRHARVGQRGLIYCGVEDVRSIRSIFDKMLIRFKTDGDSKSHFRAVIKWVPSSEMCYDVTNGGVTYTGKVNYTRTFEPCLPWAEVTHCPHHPFKSGDEFANLDGNYCRNPDRSLRPWCYTNPDGCLRNYCDACHLESPFNRADDCDQRRKDGFCTEDAAKAVHSCACKCKDLLPSTGPTQIYTDIKCGPPVIPVDAEVVGDLNPTYKLGDEVLFKCARSINVVTAKCTTSGDWSSIGSVCTECPLGSLPSNETDACYVYGDNGLLYPEAKKACADINGTVPMPKSLVENKIVSSVAKREVVWLGMTDLAHEGTFVWEDGTPLVWTNWNSGEPNNWGGNEDCVVMKSNGLWNDMYCEVSWSRHAAVCLIPKIENNLCVDMLTDNKCGGLLNTKPTMCQEIPTFAEEFCAKTCGVCDADGISCAVPPTSVGLVALTNKTSLSVGDFVRYDCEEDYYRNGGSEYQVCQADGQLTGKPMVCKDLLGSTVKVGLPTLFKHNVEVPKIVAFTGENDLWRIQHKGVIVAWEFYSNSPMETAFQVWRVVDSKAKYKLIGQNVLTTGNDMEQRYLVPRDERINVEPGDLIGLWNSGKGGVHFKVCDKVEKPGWNGVSWGRRISSPSGYRVGATFPFSAGDGCCEFSFRAEIAVKG